MKHEKSQDKAQVNNLISKDVIRHLLTSVVGNSENFKATKRFHQATGINPHRWAKLYKGELSINLDELAAVCRYIGVKFTAETFARQLTLFD